MSNDLRLRLGGLLSIAIGVGLGWFAFWKPLQEARAHAESVAFYPKLFILMPVCIVFGLAFLFAGAALEYRDEEQKSLTPTGWALFAVSAVMAGLAYWWMHRQIGALGYV